MKKLLTKDFFQIINKGLISIVDQGFFSGTNFLISLLLGRWLYPDDYGAFSVASSVFLLVSGIFNALLFEPLSVLGSREKEKDSYYSSIVLLHLILSIVIIGLFYVISLFYPFGDIFVVQTMILFSPLILSFWLIRRFDYSTLLPKRSLVRSMIYTASMIVVVYVFNRANWLSASNYFCILGVVSVVICLPEFLKIQFVSKRKLIEVIKIHWQYGKWISIVPLFHWISTQVYMVWVANYLSLSESAGFRSIQNFTQPIEQITVALTLFFLPLLSNKYAEPNGKAVVKRLPLVSLLFTFIGLIYGLIFYIFRYEFIHFVYNGKYDEYIWLVPIMLMIPIMMAISQGAQIGSRIILKPQHILIGYSVSSAFTLLFVPNMIHQFGIQGAATGKLISVSIYSLVISVLFSLSWKKIKNNDMVDVL